MFKRFIATLFCLFSLSAFANTDINKADAAALESVPGIGVALSDKILAERQKGAFKDWADVIDRVPGVGPKSAVKLSANGLRVNGAAYEGGASADAKAADLKAAAAPKK